MIVNQNIIDAVIVEEGVELTLDELSRACAVNAEWIVTLVDEGILEPLDIAANPWRFNGICLRRVRIIQHLQQDLEVNLAGAALALQLLEEIDSLQLRITALEAHVKGS
ncbi:MerR family transcriptional regulator [Nitrosomonas nitrosa]|jgi:chaperone modulatory protein CbpM|uniref:chaperone modulator CbpM n=1 Tax=Nitrosomonas nitrosa TaxID=52442 RepID=UPI000D4BCB8F|nr:chaperone modulator CbpM [Nitrosomonas nitrosa]PTQ94724.1 MerR family transcriptional regulator [Nitrosomonas nitrosa]